MQWDRITLTDCPWVPDQVSIVLEARCYSQLFCPRKYFSPQLFLSVCFLASLSMRLARSWRVCHTGISTVWYFFCSFTVRHRRCLDWHTQSVLFLGWSRWVLTQRLTRQRTTSGWSWFTYRWPGLWKWMLRYRLRHRSSLSVGNEHCTANSKKPAYLDSGSVGREGLVLPGNMENLQE